MQKDKKTNEKNEIPSPFTEEINHDFIVDKEPDKNDYYYDAMECLNSGKSGVKEALKLLETALEMDEDYVQTYVGLISTYGILGKEEETEEMIQMAYKKTLKKFPKWPRSMQWGFLENRAYLRAIQFKAEQYWDNEEDDKAIELFRLLLKLNPNDNQGVRYEIAGLYAGLCSDDINEMFDYGNCNQDWGDLETLVLEQNKKYKFWKELKY